MRVEILNGVERRRRWPEEEKRRITEESFGPGAKVSDVARKHGVSRSLLFTWRREARVVDGLTVSNKPRLIPVHVIPPPSLTPGIPVKEPAPQHAPQQSPRSRNRKSGLIEIDLGSGKGVRADAHVDADALGRVLDVLGRK